MENKNLTCTFSLFYLCWLQDAFAAERRKAKMLNFSIAYGKTAVGLSRDWKVLLSINGATSLFNLEFFLKED